MITYIDSSNKSNYDLLFDKASMKLGLMPIVKDDLDENGDQKTDANGDPLYLYFRRVPDGQGGWTEESLTPYSEDPVTGEPDPNADIDKDGNILVDDGNGGKVAIHKISTLNEYFQNMVEIAKLAMGVAPATVDGIDLRHGTDPYLLRLPLDEPFFEINANTRAISVPAALSQIGVVGDKFAEMVFFKIDRYYDAVDLDTREIYIEWEDAAGNKGVSREFLRDTQSEPDKIIFGWLINENLTKEVGTIRFAVRFVEWIDQKDSMNAPETGTGLAYSFSSLPAQITVVDSLHYDLFEDVHDNPTKLTNDDIRSMQWYLENSTPDTADDTTPATAADPIWVRDINNKNEILGWEVIDDNTFAHDLVSDGHGGYALELIVEAATEGEVGSLSYAFGRKADVFSGTDPINSHVEFMEVTLENQIASNDPTVYYELDNGAYIIASHDALNTKIGTLGSIQVFEKVAKTKVALPGYYYAIARSAVAGKKAGRAETKKVLVPKAVAPTIEEAGQMPASFVLNKVNYDIDIDEEMSQNVTPYRSNLNVVATEVADTDEIVLAPTISLPLKRNAISYQWYKATEDAPDAFVAIPDATDATYTANAPGYYTLSVTNNFNNNDATLEKEDIRAIHISEMPILPTVNFPQDWAAIMAIDNYSIPVTFTGRGTVHYQWHMVTTQDPTDPDLVPTGNMEAGTIEGDIAITNGVGAIPFRPKRAGAYYLVVSTTYNGATIVENLGKRYIIQISQEGPAPVEETYNVTYSFEIPAGREYAEGALVEDDYPEFINDLCPDAEEGVAIGLVNPAQLKENNKTTVVVDDAEVGALGTWTFDGWTPEQGEIIDDNIEFVGSWTFTPASENENVEQPAGE